ncbi:MAG: hypothetical protein U0802_25940 [Candidatus Binatia bacterium]
MAARGTQKVAGPQQPSVKHTESAGQSALVVQGATQVGTMHSRVPSVVGTHALPPGHEKVEQLSAT